MADGITFTTRVVFNRFPVIKAGMEAHAVRATAVAATGMVAGMVAAAPVDTGFLRNSIQAQQIGPAHWRVTVGAEYGIYLEYGTRFMGAQPFFFPTVADVGATFIADMRRIAG